MRLQLSVRGGGAGNRSTYTEGATLPTAAAMSSSTHSRSGRLFSRSTHAASTVETVRGKELVVRELVDRVLPRCTPRPFVYNMVAALTTHLEEALLAQEEENRLDEFEQNVSHDSTADGSSADHVSSGGDDDADDDGTHTTTELDDDSIADAFELERCERPAPPAKSASLSSLSSSASSASSSSAMTNNNNNRIPVENLSVNEQQQEPEERKPFRYPASLPDRSRNTVEERRTDLDLLDRLLSNRYGKDRQTQRFIRTKLAAIKTQIETQTKMMTTDITDSSLHGGSTHGGSMHGRSLHNTRKEPPATTTGTMTMNKPTLPSSSSSSSSASSSSSSSTAATSTSSSVSNASTRKMSSFQSARRSYSALLPMLEDRPYLFNFIVGQIKKLELDEIDAIEAKKRSRNGTGSSSRFFRSLPANQRNQQQQPYDYNSSNNNKKGFISSIGTGAEHSWKPEPAPTAQERWMDVMKLDEVIAFDTGMDGSVQDALESLQKMCSSQAKSLQRKEASKLLFDSFQEGEESQDATNKRTDGGGTAGFDDEPSDDYDRDGTTTTSTLEQLNTISRLIQPQR